MIIYKEECLSVMKSFHLVARVTLANHLTLSRLWYSLARVKLSAITLYRQQGGLGLLSLPHQVRALVGSVFIKALCQEDDHPLRKFIQYRLHKLFYDK